MRAIGVVVLMIFFMVEKKYCFSNLVCGMDYTTLLPLSKPLQSNFVPCDNKSASRAWYVLASRWSHFEYMDSQECEHSYRFIIFGLIESGSVHCTFFQNVPMSHIHNCLAIWQRACNLQ
jgi:hypothetical protein